MIANELRIGNYIHVPGLFHKSNVVGVVESITKEELITDKCEANVSLFEPIPLTEEWLINLGFEKKTYQHLTLYYYSLRVLSHGEIAFHAKDHGFNLDIGTTTGYQFGTTNIKSVHQLQNLYFSLTGEEFDTLALCQ